MIFVVHCLSVMRLPVAVFPASWEESPRLHFHILAVMLGSWKDHSVSLLWLSKLPTWCIFICCLLDYNCFSPEKVNVSGICYGKALLNRSFLPLRYSWYAYSDIMLSSGYQVSSPFKESVANHRSLQRIMYGSLIGEFGLAHFQKERWPSHCKISVSLEMYWIYNLQHTQFSKQDGLWTCMMPVFSETGVLCRPRITWDTRLCISLTKIRKNYDTISIQCSCCDLFWRLFKVFLKHISPDKTSN